MAKEVMEKLEEQLNCSICLDTYRNPKLLQCFHVYCQGCLVKLVVRDLQGRDSITCPVCRQVTPIDPTRGARGLQPAFHINRLLEIQDSVKKIQDLPVKQEDTTAGNSFSSKVNVAPVSGAKVKCCPEHLEEELKLYCSTCKDLICCECAIKRGKHHDHEYETIKTAFKLYEGEITASLLPLEEQLKATDKTLAQLDQVCSDLSKQRMEVETDVHKKVERLHRFLDARKIELIQELHEATQLRLKCLATQRDQVETLQARLSSCLEFVRGSLESGNQGEVLLMRSSTAKQVTELTNTHLPNVWAPKSMPKTTFLLSSDITLMCKSFGKLLSSDNVRKSSSTATGIQIDKQGRYVEL